MNSGKDFITVRVVGGDSKDEILNHAKTISEACHKNGICKALVDMRESTDRVAPMETFNMATKDLPNILFNRVRKIAFLRKELNENDMFFENVLRNRGHLVQIFTDPDEAQDWISS